MSSLLTTLLLAQSKPEGMNYQAVARNLKGEILANQPVALKVKLFSTNSLGKMEYYSEVHDVITSPTGVFSLVIGKGTSDRGVYNNIPWSSENIWMEVSIRSKGQSDFAVISNSKLLAVPYAYHALTAGKLTGETGAPVGSPANNWILFGNRGSNPLTDKLGTTDSVDLVMVTNDIERLRIYANGDIFMKKSLRIGANLTVDSSAYLNKVGGATINYGPFTVDRQSPTLLSGTLTVDRESDLNSSLNVDGPTDLNSRLFVNNISPTLLTGILTVNKDGLFKEKVLLDNASYQATSPATGALVVNGGVGIGRNLFVGGTATFNGPLVVTDPTQSTSTTTGAVIVTGGLGLGKNINIGGSLTAAGVATINNTLNVNASTPFIANFVNSSNANGISIQLANPEPGNPNNFVEFRKANGGIVGRIEGETSGELNNNEDYLSQKKSLELAKTMATIDVVTGGIDVAMAGVDLVGAASSSTACAGLGVCVTAPVPSLIVAAGIKLASAIANEISVALGLDDANTQLNYFLTTTALNIGVTYQSGSGDYAEWLPKASMTEKFNPGFIVGMKNGKISLNSAGADKLFVISTKPIVLGNMPEEGKEAGYEKVAFMGQVPVHVLGKVNAGDYIVPSGNHNGFGKAISPDKMKPADYANIVGMAWSSGNESYNVVNVAIGLNTGDISKVVNEQSKEISALRSQISETNNILAKLIPGFKEAAGIKGEPVVKAPVVVSNPPVKDQHNINFVKQDESTVVYFDITTQQTQEMIDRAQQIFVEKGGDVNTHPFWKKISTDAGYKNAVMEKMKSIFKTQVHTHKEINSHK